MKQEAYAACLHYVEQRIRLFQEAIREAQHGANSETKSTAGDKHETGRAMAQLETEKNSAHLAEAMKLKAILGKINPEEQHDTIRLGSLVECSNGWFYMAIGAGKLQLKNNVVFAVSLASPIGQQLLGKKAGEDFRLNGQSFEVKKVG